MAWSFRMRDQSNEHSADFQGSVILRKRRQDFGAQIPLLEQSAGEVFIQLRTRHHFQQVLLGRAVNLGR
jgi:hypothetical protein